MKNHTIAINNIIGYFVPGVCFGLYFHSWLIGIAIVFTIRQLTPYEQ